MEKDYKELVAVIDSLMKKGSGHVNVKTGESGKIDKIFACDQKGTACSVPTLFEDIDK